MEGAIVLEGWQVRTSLLGTSALTPLAPKLTVPLGLIPSTTKIKTINKSIKQMWAFGIQDQEGEAGGLGVQGFPLFSPSHCAG